MNEHELLRWAELHLEDLRAEAARHRLAAELARQRREAADAHRVEARESRWRWWRRWRAREAS